MIGISVWYSDRLIGDSNHITKIKSSKKIELKKPKQTYEEYYTWIISRLYFYIFRGNLLINEYEDQSKKVRLIITTFSSIDSIFSLLLSLISRIWESLPSIALSDRFLKLMPTFDQYEIPNQGFSIFPPNCSPIQDSFPYILCRLATSCSIKEFSRSGSWMVALYQLLNLNLNFRKSNIFYIHY